MVDAAVQHRDTEFQQPYAKPGPALSAAVTHGEPLSTNMASGRPYRRNVAADGAARCWPVHRHRLPDTAIPRMIVHMVSGWQRCRWTGRSALSPLPQQVRRRFLEPLQGNARTGRRHHTAAAAQHLVHRRDRRTAQTVARETVRDLACTPRRMRIPHCQDPRLHKPGRPIHALIWSPGRQRTLAIKFRRAPPEQRVIPSVPFVDSSRCSYTVMAGLVPAIRSGTLPRWMAGTSPAMTEGMSGDGRYWFGRLA